MHIRANLDFLNSAKKCAAFFVLVSAVQVPAVSFALSAGPMLGIFSPFGTGSRTTITVSNNGKDAVSVDISVVQIVGFDVNNDEILSPADDDLLAFPPAFQLQAGGSQKLQVQYVGDPELKASKTYRIIVEGLPITNVSGSSVGVGTTLNTLYSVVPSSTASSLKVLDLTPSDDDRYPWNITLENSGSKYVRLSETTWTFSKNQDLVVVEPADVDAITAQNLVLPGTSRIVQLAAPAAIELDDNVSIQIAE